MSETATATTAFTPDKTIVTNGQLLVLDADERTATITALPMGVRERLAGAWSIDIMVDTAGLAEGEARYWLIDAAPMRASALAEQLRTTDEYRLAPLERVLELSSEQVLDPRHWRSQLMAPPMPGSTETEPGQAVTWRYRWGKALEQ